MKWFLKCIGPDFANFEGRARRKEYWHFILFSFILMLVAIILDRILFSKPFTPIKWLLSLYLLVPQMAVMFRRLHDIGRSGGVVIWYYALGIVWSVLLVISGFSTVIAIDSGLYASFPAIVFALLLGGGILFLVWGIFFLVWFCKPGMEGENKYGPDPKAE